MPKKIRVGVLFGGKSAEHEVSLQSAKNVIDAIDRTKYDVVPIGIDKTGQWFLADSAKYLLNAENPKLIKLNKSNETLALVPGERDSQLMVVSKSENIGKLDVIFPILHGTYGEDGTIQGFLKLAGIPFVGAGVLSSAVGMDKEVAKRLMRDAGIPTAKFLAFRKHEKTKIRFQDVSAQLGMPLFVKPANLGSSVGVHKVKDETQFGPAVSDAFEYDDKILIEEAVKGREIEVAVLGNSDPIASVPGEVIPSHEFYSYEAKYIDEAGAALEIPAKLSPAMVKKFQELAVRTFKVLCCEGMARVDFFYRGEEEAMVNEINTIPGFTKISMYPKLWQASGISYKELIDRLIQLAIERHERESQLKTSYSS